MSGKWPEVDRRGQQRRHGDRRSDGWVHRRVYIGVFLFVVAFIVYGSLYPFQWYDRQDGIGAMAYLLSTAGDWDQATNLIVSILLYVPFGFLAMYALSPDLDGQVRVMGTFAAGVMLSIWIELAQYQDVGHVSTMGDVYATAIGLVIGIAGAGIAQSQSWSPMRALGAAGIEAALLVMWAGDRLYPYVPVPGIHEFATIVVPLADLSTIDPLDLARSLVRWLMVACLADALFGGRSWWRLYPLFVLGEVAARVLVSDGIFLQSDAFGAVAAPILWLLLRQVPMSRLLLAVAFAALVAVVRLSPFDFMGIPNNFGWLPFQTLLAAPLATALRIVFRDAFLYGGLIWLLATAGLRLGGATAVTVLLLLGISFAQCWTTGAPGEITDALMAGLIGSVLYLMGGEELAERRAGG